MHYLEKVKELIHKMWKSRNIYTCITSILYTLHNVRSYNKITKLNVIIIINLKWCV